MELHQAGELAQAKDIYLQVLSAIRHAPMPGICWE